jgi:hypothetical protein
MPSAVQYAYPGGRPSGIPVYNPPPQADSRGPVGIPPPDYMQHAQRPDPVHPLHALLRTQPTHPHQHIGVAAPYHGPHPSAASRFSDAAAGTGY